MKYLPSPSTILAFTLGGLLLGSHLVFGFTEPGQLPGGGNVLPPLDTSATGQAKAGGLIVNTGGAPVGFIVDKGSVGIGTNNPGGTLDVQGSSVNPIGVFNQIGSGDIANFLDSGISAFILKKGGNVGIGTTSPIAKLHVAGNMQVDGNMTTSEIRLIDSASVCAEGKTGTLRWNSNSLQFCQYATVTTTSDIGGGCNAGCPGGTALYCISCWGTCYQYMCRYTTTSYEYKWVDVSHN